MDGERGLTCVALATGMKCLPQAKLAQAKGNVLHDWHAEVLALRGFNRWILDECLILARDQGKRRATEWVQWAREHDGACMDGGDTGPPFELKPDVAIHMYCSATPCGDASMDLLMRSQLDSTPWTHPAPSANPDDMLGRGHFDRLGVVRRKPARPDAPSTLSKSCSDKLSMRQVTGLLGGLAGKLVRSESAYLKSLVLPEGEVVREGKGVDRAFGREGRMRELVGWEGIQGYQFRPFEVLGTTRKFDYCAEEGCRGSDLSALWTPHRQEILINGVLQGRKQFDPRGASCVSRSAMWGLAKRVAAEVGEGSGGLDVETYEMATRSFSGAREAAKQEAREKALKGWRRNTGDEEWGLGGT